MNTDESQAVVLYVLVMIAIACILGAFMGGRYIAEKDMKAKYHMNHCVIWATGSACHDGVSLEEHRDTVSFVEMMGVSNG